ncbi:PREDICTED: uncharacterized protein LOC108767924 [Trachymyrmex cornetzi]|uniref:uncharacterized protein LOC108767924 n=1 Tax=Trachymyrmex cornetzi TaxID=471704 RepID=UPI00084EDD78|nr:PREDICTED: uncharacterized protein LOC108767924 [Trachymyrmex cornetzi]
MREKTVERQITNRRLSRFDVNTKAVIGVLHGGLGHTHLNKILSCLNIPTIDLKGVILIDHGSIGHHQSQRPMLRSFVVPSAVSGSCPIEPCPTGCHPISRHSRDMNKKLNRQQRVLRRKVVRTQQIWNGNSH